MGFGTVTTILADPKAVAGQVASAADLARRLDAHLELLALGVDEVQMGYFFAGGEAIVPQPSLDVARDLAQELARSAKEAVDREQVLNDVNGVVAQFGALHDVVARTTRFSDLVVLPAPYVGEALPRDELILEAALFGGHAPVLVMPETGLPQDFGKRIVIGWNDGAEAMAAVRAALPLLRAAERCHIAIIDPLERDADQAGPGRSLSTMLDRHGVKAEVALLPKTHPSIAQVLSDHAKDVDASLIVAGAYGHSRFRQAILGGATRDLLGGIGLPVLLSH
ncbi:MAG: universal stress protein [Qingshengfaniella sp.]